MSTSDDEDDPDTDEIDLGPGPADADLADDGLDDEPLFGPDAGRVAAPTSLWDRVGDVHPGFTYALVLLLLVVFAAELVTATGRVGDPVMSGSLRGPLIERGAAAIVPFRAGEWWRAITAVFLHANLVHVGSNVLALVFVGGVAERTFGHARFLLLFLLAGLAGSAATLSHQAYELASGSADVAGSIGASGAVFGLGAAIVAAATRLRGLLPRWRVRALIGAVLPLLLTSLASGFARPGTDNAAHVGGATAGLVLGFVLPLHRRLRLGVLPKEVFRA